MFSNILGGAAGFPVADLGDEISQSLRFGSGRRLFNNDFSQNHGEDATISFWFKRGKLGTLQTLGCQDNGQHNLFARFNTSDQLVVLTHGGDGGFTTTRRFRDTSAWYHFVLTDEKCWINGEVIDTGTFMDGQESHSRFNIGLYGANLTQHFDGYMADFYFVDGTNMDATDFGRYNDDGIWVPETPTISSYGNNGFHLTFDSSQTNGIGHDSSGQDNHFTASGFDTSAVSSTNTSNDVGIPDTPTTLYPTYNFPACHSSQTLSDANLATSASSYTFAPATISIPANCGKKFYWEVTVTNVSGNPTIGMTDPTQRVGQQSAYNWVWAPTLEDIESPQGNISDLVDTGVSTVNTASGTTYMFAYDADTQNVWIGDNGNWYKRDGAAGVGNPGAGTNPFLTVSDNCIIDGNTYAPCTAGSSAGTTAYEMNFGQFDFQHTVPTGFVDLNSENLPEPEIIDGKKHFNILTWDGTDSSNTITGLDFQPDFVWVKKTTGSESHRLADVNRGSTVGIASDNGNAETDVAGSISSFNSDGITVTNAGQTNESGDSYVAWCWKAGGTPVENTNGSITSNVSANTDAGFSIVTYTGNGSNSTVGHGLTKTPEFVMYKRRDASQGWGVYTSELLANEYLQLDVNDAAFGSQNTIFNNTRPSASVLHIGTQGSTNTNNGTYVAYCWHSVEGYSKIGTYVGNGSADGSFVYLGFRPRWLLFKGNGSSCNWEIQDSTRCTTNPMLNVLYPNRTDSQTGNDTANAVDFLANGFKLRNNASNHNQNGREFIYIAFAENPFVGENVPPATAR